MRWTVAVLALALAACGDDPIVIEVPDPSGAWTADIEVPHTPNPYTVNIQVRFDFGSDGLVVGCAAFSDLGGTWQVYPVSGTVDGANVTLSAPWSNWSFTGSYADETMTGQSSGLGAPIATTFEREPAPIC